MEHILQFAINIDDERIKQVVAEKAEKEIIANLKNEVGRIIFERNPYRAQGYYENRLSEWSKNRFETFLTENRDAIIAGAAQELANRLSRTKAAKAIIEDLT